MFSPDCAAIAPSTQRMVRSSGTQIIMVTHTLTKFLCVCIEDCNSPCAGRRYLAGLTINQCSQS